MKRRIESRTGNRRRTSKRVRKQQHLLDVTVRSRKATQRRNQLVMRVLFTLIVVGGLSTGAWLGAQHLLERYLWENADYALRDVQTFTDGKLTRSEILEKAGIREGANIFSVKLSEARSRLQELPQVEYVEMKRVLPDKITVKVSERHPVAWVVRSADKDPASSAHAFLVDEKGILFQSPAARRDVLVLPVIHGADVEQLRAGEVVSEPELVAALNLLRMAGREPRFIIQTIDVSRGYCMVAMDRRHSKVTFGLDRLDFQLERLGRLLSYLDDTQQEIQTVNLMVERNVPARLASLGVPEDVEVEAEAEPAQPAATPPRTSRPLLPAPARSQKPEPEVRRAEPARPVRRAEPVRR